MSGDAWITLVTVLVTVALLVSERYPPVVPVLGAVTLLLVADVIDFPQAFGGFANEAPITVAALYVLAGAAETTGATSVLTTWLGRDRGERRNLARLTGMTAAMSSFVNNTTVVAASAPAVASWARRRNLAPARYLLPCSYAALLGGLVTAIGTSTNVTVSGLLRERDLDPIGFFEISKVGLPIAAAGIAVLVVTVPLLLPRRRDAVADLAEHPREFTVEMVVAGAPLVGKTIEEGGLRHLQGVFLVEIARDDHVIAPVAPDETLEAGDRLLFAGNVTRVVDLQRIRGLVAAEQHHFDLGGGGLEQRFFEVVIGPSSVLAGTTLKRAGFRGRYNAAVVAVHRAGERVAEKLGDVTLRAGDVLLVLAGRGFAERWRDRGDFLVISPLGGTNPIRSRKAWLVYLVGAFFVVTAASGALSLVEAGLLSAMALVGLRVLSPAEARAAVDIEVIVLIAVSFGLGRAVEASGLALELASGMVRLLDGFGTTGTLAAVFLATTLLTALISNNAAAVLMFPVAFAVADEVGADPRPFAIAIAVAASTDFLTPFGYQTNTMVFGMGRYRFVDFVKAGFPLTVTVAVLAVLLIPRVWPY